MGFFKKRKTYTSADIQNIFNKEEYEAERKAGRKYAMHQYLADTSGKYAWELDVDLVDYLLGGDENQYANRWDKAFQYSTTAAYSHTGQMKNTDWDKYQGEYYPVIQLKGGTLNDPKGVQETKELCKILNLDHDDLVERFKAAYGGEWWNLQACGLALAVELHDGYFDENADNKGKLHYMYRYFDNLLNVRKATGCEVSQHHVKFHNVMYSITQSDISIEPDDKKLGWHVYSFYSDSSYSTESTTQCKKDDNGGDGGSGRNRTICTTTTHKIRWRRERIQLQHRKSGVLQNKIEILVSTEKAYWHDAAYYTEDDSAPQPLSSGWFRDIQNINVLPFINRRDPERIDTVHGWLVNHGFPMDAGTESDLLVLPIDRKLISDFSPKEKSNFLRENMYVFHTWQKTVKEYRGWVKPFMKIGAVIAAIVITIKSVGSGAKVGMTLVKAAFSMAVGFAIDKLVDFAVKIGLISARTAIVVKSVVAVVMVARGAGWDFSKILTAPNIMKAINVSFNTYTKMKEHDIKELNKQMNEHNTAHAKRMYDLQEKQRLHLDGFSKVASLYLHTPSFTPKVDLFETPEMMYARHRNYNVVGVSQGLISHLADGLYTGRPKLYQINNGSDDIEDLLIIS